MIVSSALEPASRSAPGPTQSGDCLWQIFVTAQEAWDAMYDDCAAARDSIELEQYILEHDAQGRRFMELFVRKAKEGVKVFIIADKFGSSLLTRSRYVKELRRAGGHFYFFNPLNIFDTIIPWRWFPRTHVKTLLIDSKIAYTGGVCIAERMSDWRDTQIRIEGPVVEQIAHAFDRMQRRIPKFKVKRPPKTKNPGESCFTYLLNRPKIGRYRVYEELIKAVLEARSYIYISTPFFAPNRRFFELMAQACERGVDLRLLVPEHSDVALADWVCMSYARRLIETGVKIFYYKPTVLHQKTVVIDDSWATIGSTNIDIISFFYNREANLVVNDDAIAVELRRQFLVDLQSSEELTLERLAMRPWWKKAVGIMARMLKFFF